MGSTRITRFNATNWANPPPLNEESLRELSKAPAAEIRVSHGGESGSPSPGDEVSELPEEDEGLSPRGETTGDTLGGRHSG